jgi:eukaryotic-like serine/threonine-protein kinase
MSVKDFIFSKIFAKNLGLAVLIIVGLLMVLLIWLNFYTRHGQSRSVPDFHGLNMQETARLAKKSKLKYIIIDSVYTAAVPKGCVAEQNPEPGYRVKKWREIALTINAFRPEMVSMPDLIDLPLRQANLLIESSGLKMGKRIYKPDLSFDVVLDQLYNGNKINKNDSLQKGSVIDLVIGRGLNNQRTPVPDLLGMSLAPATNRILESSLNLGTYSYDNTILTAADTLNAFVFKQIPESKDDATLQVGSTVYLWLSVDSTKLPVDSTNIFIIDTVPPASGQPVPDQSK